VAKKFLTPITPPALSSDPSGGTAGSIYYNTVAGALKIYNGTTWSLLTGSGGGETSAIEVLDESPTSPSQGRIYFDSAENTIKIWNGNIWYDVAGPKEMLDHQHYAGEGLVRYTVYGGYVDDTNLVFMDGGTSTSTFTNDIIDGGASI
jgi:hypothetical protein